MTNSAFFDEMDLGLTGPTTLSGISTCFHPIETGRSPESAQRKVVGTGRSRRAFSGEAGRDARRQRRRLADRSLLRGYVEAKSNPAGRPNVISPHYLSEKPARRAIIGGLRIAPRMFASLAYARRDGGTSDHAIGACMMASPSMSVIDNELRVRELSGLSIIDA